MTARASRRCWCLDRLNGIYITLFPEDEKNPDCYPEIGDAMIVYALEDADVLFASETCDSIDLRNGMNLIGAPCAPEDYSAYDLLIDLGPDSIVSIQRFDTIEGKFETVGYDENGVIQGVDFILMPGEGYFVTMKVMYNDFSFE